MNAVRYAMHRLVIDSGYVSSVLAERDRDGRWHLSPFECETERTIYVDGTSRLRPGHAGEPQVQSIPFSAIISSHPITIVEAQGRLNAHPGIWVLEIPED